MKDIINIAVQPKTEDIVMEKNEASGSFQYVIAEIEDTASPEISDNFSIDFTNDFEDLKEIIQSAKNMSGGIQNVIAEVSKIDNIGPTDTVSVISGSIIFAPEKDKKPIKRPTSETFSSIINKPKLIEPESLDFKCSRDLRNFCDLLSIISLYKNNLIHFLRAMFQGGGVNHDHKCFKYKNITVLLEGKFIEELNMILPFGAWHNNETLEYGYDIISLCIYYLKRDFSTVLTMLSEIAEEHYNRLRINDITKSPRNIQVKNPIGSSELRRLHIKGAKKIHSSYYSTTYGVRFKGIEYWELSNGEIEPVYYTMWCPWNSLIYHCQALYPQPPYSLYKLDLIHKNQNAIILFVDNEMVADHKQENTDPSLYVYTTCFGGHKNLLEVNVSYLSGRDIHLYYDSESEAIHHIPEAIKRLLAQNVRDIQISFDNGESIITSDEFMKDPAKWGCNLEAENENAPKNQYRIVPSGEKAGGEDKENTVLLYPIIEGGNIIWIFGEAKSFKSWIGYKIACALSIGDQIVGKWKSGDAVKVLYIDGEMRPNKIKRRLDLIKRGMNYELEERPFDLYIVKDSSGANVDTDILSEEWQNNMASDLNRADVIVLDNFYSLTDNSQKSVKSAISWFTKLSQAGKTVIVLDHSNREGDVQGSISKERAADLVIKIEPDKDVKNKVKISLPKPRDLHPNDTESFELLMVFEDGAFRMELVDDDDENDQPLSERDFKIALALELTNARGVDREKILDMLQIKQATYYKYLKEELPRLTEKQKFQVKSEADRLLEALTS